MGRISTKYLKVGKYAKKYGIPKMTVYRWASQKRLLSRKTIVEILEVEDKKVEKKARYKLPPKFGKI